MKCVIIDDEPLAIEVIKKHITRIEGLELIKTFHLASKAIAFVQSEEVDLIFLDLHMPNLSGIEFLNAIPSPPLTIITTAYREYALKGFQLDVIDYLLKPIDFNFFLKAIGKAYRRKNLSLPSIIKDLKPEDNNIHPSKPFVYLKVDKTIEKVFLKDIYIVESMKNYVKIQTLNKQLIIYNSISKLEEKLPKKYFIRVHRSYIVSKDKIDKYELSSLLIGGKYKVPVGGSYREKLLDLLNKQIL